MTESARSQKERTLGVKTGAGDDNLQLISMHGTETMSRLFQYELEMLADDTVEVTKVIGKSATIELDASGSTMRYFNGIVSKFTFTRCEEVTKTKNTYYYRATVVPKLWLLTRRSNCRIFQKKTIPEIIKTIFGEHSVDIRSTLKGTYNPWDYCVQYRETDFNFVSRLMENEGIYYFFEHKDGSHTMVLCDDMSAHEEADGYGALAYLEPGSSADHDACVWNWNMGQEITPNKYTLRDYNPLTPSTQLESKSESKHPGDPESMEIYDFPGGYQVKKDGDVYALARCDEVEAFYSVVHAMSSARGIHPGCKFNVHSPPSFISGADFVITSASYLLEHDEEEEEGHSFRCQITCIPKSVAYRPARITPKPVVQGLQTAVVVGPAGEEIYTDKYGRIKVQFFWDREGKKNENSSCWIRVAQNWAGKNWGIIFNPRIGQEVIVDFLEGDPDRPIITGRVYNAEQMPPYTLPDKQTQSTIKTRSSKGGEMDNFNEIRFEDLKGSEELFIHAEKNQTIEVEKDESHWVGHDRSKKIDHDETTKVGHDREETVDNDETITIHGERTETVDKDETITIHGARTETVDKDEQITISGSRTETVEKAETITLNDNQTVTIQKDQSVTVNGGQTVTVAKDQSISISQKLTVVAAEQITFTTGDASIVMKKDGSILISGKDIVVKGSGKISASADSDMTLKGSKIAAN